MALVTSKAIGVDPVLNMARQALYRFAALSLADPRVGSWQELRRMRDDRLLAEAAALIRTRPQARPVKLGAAELRARHLDPTNVLERLPASHVALNAEYENTFGLVVGSACPPYETEYIDSKFAFQRSNTLADISGFYYAFGLAISDERPERPDHIALELEFMASLLALERRAAEGDSTRREGRLNICRAAQARFLKEHLAWWVPAFAKLLAHESSSDFYRAVGVFLAALIPVERALLKVESQSRNLAPSPEEKPDACDGCQLAT
jgi:TorA maturation chaperone TorD